MRARLWPFVFVGVLATAVDLFLLLALTNRDVGRTLADIIALFLAAAFAYLVNRLITFRGDTTARWVRNPGLFAITAVSAGAIDLVVLSVLDELWLPLVVAKVLAIGCAAVVRFTAYRWVLFRWVRKGLAQRVDRPTPEGQYRLTVLVPAYNESAVITRTVDEIEECLTQQLDRDEFEIVVVDDGSSDDTVELAEQAGARVVRQPQNCGKGAAIRAGARAAEGRAVVFTDADLAYAPEHLLRLLAEIEDGWDMVVGSRRHHDTEVVVKPTRLRSVGGRLINLMTHSVLLSAFNDTQCGLKGFQADVARVMFQRTRINGFAFDIELFLIAEQDDLSVREIPVSVQNRIESSVVLFSHTMELLFDLFRLRRWVGDGVYNPNPEQSRVLAARRESAGSDRADQVTEN